MKTTWRYFFRIQPRIYWLIALAAVLMLFPFDWLSEVWPAFGQIFDRVFVTARDHAIGHTTIFVLAGLMILCAFPALRKRPIFYVLVMISGALGEEAFQALSRWHIPNLGSGRDLGFDVLGFTLAYLFVWGWLRLRRLMKASEDQLA